VAGDDVVDDGGADHGAGQDRDRINRSMVLDHVDRARRGTVIDVPDDRPVMDHVVRLVRYDVPVAVVAPVVAVAMVRERGRGEHQRGGGYG
jgi:hypothetical protein